MVREITVQAGSRKPEIQNVPASTQLIEMVAGKGEHLPFKASPEEKLSRGKNLAAESKEEEVEMKSLDGRDNRLSKPNRDATDERPLAIERNDMNVVEDENMKVLEDEKLRVGEESSDCLSSSSRRALKRTAQITPPPGKDTTKV